MTTTTSVVLPFAERQGGAAGRVTRRVALQTTAAMRRAAVAALLRRYGAPRQFALPLADRAGYALEITISDDEPIGALAERLGRLTEVARSGDHFPFGLSETAAAPPSAPVRFDATLCCCDDDGGTLLAIAHEATIETDAAPRMLRHLEVVLRAAVAAPETAVGDLPVLDDDEARFLIEEVNHTARPFDERPIIERIARYAAEHPDRPALIVGERRFTYGDVLGRANQLARFLQQRGIGPGDRVAIAHRRDDGLIAAVLGIMASGAAYVPLDPRNPAARTALILDDADVRLVLADADALQALASRPEPSLDVAAIDLAAYSPEPLPTAASPHDVAYAIFTSGSTGRPKGVVIDHRSLAAFIGWTDRAFDDDEMSGVLCSSSIAFDVSVFELFAPLVRGGCVILVDDILALPAAPARDDVRTISTVATGFAELLRAATLPRGVRTALQAGERLGEGLARRLLAHDGIRLINLCGATEDTVYSVWYHVTDVNGNPPIGRPFENHTVYVVDERMRPVPIGVPGEICYGGAGVAVGYLNRPELTAERFVPNPFGHSQRMYRSGDIVRWNSQGELEFIGRRDDQIKIRGFRVELGEIERALLDLPPIGEAVVAAVAVDGDVRLDAYVTPRGSTLPSALDVRTALASLVPSYMIPTTITVLPELPKGGSGKVDRGALPAPVLTRAGQRTAYVAPRTDTEREVAAIWSELLGIPEIGVEDDVFALGANSLHAARFVARVRERSPGLTLRSFFAAPTIAAAASYLRAVPEAPQPVYTNGMAARQTDAPASHAQEMMWFIDRVIADGATYNVPVAWRLGADRDPAALERAIAALVERHDQLRTIFPSVDGRPVARTLARLAVPLERRTVEAAQLAGAIADVSRTVFDLERGPLMRAALLETPGGDAVLVLAFHHVVCDGWSLAIVRDDLFALYAAEREGRPAQLPPLPVRYADSARGERDADHDALFEADLSWWAQRLHGYQRIDLTGDRQPPAIRTSGGGRVSCRLDARTVEALHAFNRTHRSTTFATVLAAYFVFVARYTGETDIGIGVPVAGRRYPELDRLVGNFIQMLTLRAEVDPQQPFERIAAKARETLLDAFEHETVPFRLVVDRLAPVRSQTQNPLFSVAIVAQQPLRDEVVAGTPFERVEAYTHTSKFDLLLELTEDGDAVTLTFEYAEDRFTAATVESLLGTLVHLIDGAVRAPSTLAARLPLVPATSRVALAPPPVDDPVAALRSATPVHHRFRTFAETAPDAIAVVHGAERRSYAELAAEADAIRRRLLAAGVQRGDFVGVCAQRSNGLIAALLAILDCGAAYVPLDPQHPAQRLAYVAADASLRVILTDRSSIDLLQTIEAERLLIDEDVTAGGPPLPPPLAVEPHEAAYVIYTSGSTGAPKGVVVEHGNVARLFTAADREFVFGPADVWTLFHSYAFDFSVWEIWGALAYGGRLVVVESEIARSPRDFYELCAAQGVTVLSQTPSAFYEFDDVDRSAPRELALRYVVFGGEGLDVRRLSGWLERHGDGPPALINMYGITETTVHVTYREITRADLDAALTPIGRPLADLAVTLVDAEGAIVPPAFPGEILVSGAGVARHYLGREQLTATRFVDDPTGLGRGRTYRSGDIARRRVDGSLEYVGRADQQVKIRGFRIELGEIEAALTAHPQVERAAVIVETGRGEPRLVAYVVAPEGGELHNLRAHLAATLPHYMIPSAFLRVDRLPLNANGKLDRARLAAAVTEATPLSTGEEGPAIGSVLHRRLQALFAETLGVPYVTPDASFFALGGHSLLAARLAARVEEEFPAAARRLRDSTGRGGVLGVFYRQPTVNALAAVLEGGSVEASSIVCMREGNPARTPVFWFHGMYNADGLYTWEVMSALPDDVPFYVIHPHGYNNQPFPADIERMADEHLGVIRAVRPHGPYTLGGFCNGALVAYEVAGRLAQAGEKIEGLVLVSLPPLIAIGERLRAAVERIGDRLGLGERARVGLFLYLRRQADRIDRFLRGSGGQRVTIVRNAWRRGGGKLLRLAAGARTPAPPASIDQFGDPDFKSEHYIRAIAEYAARTFAGRVDLIFGSLIVPGMVDPTGGWSRLIGETEVHVVPGAHYCVIESSSEVGRILAQAMEAHRHDTPAVATR